MSHYHLEIYENPNSFPDSELYREMSTLPLERRRKVLKFINMIDKKLSFLAYKLLRQGLEKHYNITQDETLRMGYYRNGKPTLIDYPHIHFNISHCHEAVVCAFADRPIGVDVEGLINFDEDLLQRVANPKEYKTIVNAQSPTLEFTILWTKKESYMKMTGVGLINNLHLVLDANFTTKTHFEYRYAENHNYVLGVCY